MSGERFILDLKLVKPLCFRAAHAATFTHFMNLVGGTRPHCCDFTAQCATACFDAVQCFGIQVAVRWD